MKYYFFIIAFCATLFLSATHRAVQGNIITYVFIREDNVDNEFDDVMTQYLQLKNALASDNSKTASDIAVELIANLSKIDQQTLAGGNQKTYKKLKKSVLLDAGQIIANNGKIEVQRAHFKNLSKSIYELIKSFKTSKVYYKAYCPMKKASWIEESSEIKNPYYGKKMLNCGSVKEIEIAN